MERRSLPRSPVRLRKLREKPSLEARQPKPPDYGPLENPGLESETDSGWNPNATHDISRIWPPPVDSVGEEAEDESSGDLFPSDE